jgi:16S rRNA (guanine527-N7)-methyltransferase
MQQNHASISLQQALQAVDCSVSKAQHSQLEVYLQLLATWTKKINLIAPSTVQNAAWRHVADCAQLAPHLPSNPARVVDVGSGAGLPGLVLAIIMPQHSYGLVEQDQRKSAFLRTAAHAMGLQNVAIHAVDVARIAPATADIVTARAYAPLPRLLATTQHVLTKGGRYVLLKGQAAPAELITCETQFHLTSSLIASRVDPSGWVVKLSAPVPRGTPKK